MMNMLHFRVLHALSLFSILSNTICLTIATAKVHSKPEVCLTKGCNDTAARLKRNINWTANPCEDFYKYACGGFINTTDLPDSRSFVSQFSLIEDAIDRELISVVNESIHSNDTLPTKLIKTVFSSCRNLTQINHLGVDNLLELINYIGGWPVLNNSFSNSETFNWLNTTLKSLKKGLHTSSILQFNIHDDAMNSSVNIIYISSPSMWISREDILDGMSSTLNKAHLEYMVNISVLLGANKTDAVRELTQAYELLVELANNSLTTVEMNNRTLTYNRLKVRDLKVNYSNIPWSDYLNGMTFNMYNITDDEDVVIMDMKYLTYLNANIGKMSNRSMANYMAWRAIEGILGYMNEDILRIQLQYNEIFNGQKGFPPREKFCVDVVKNDDELKLATGALYVEKYYLNSTTAAVAKIMLDVEIAFNNTLSNITWMDNMTKLAAKEKLAKMTSIIGYSEELMNQTIMDKEFKMLRLDKEYFLNSMLNVSIFRSWKLTEKLRMPVRDGQWKLFGGAATVNAFYAFFRNAMYFAAGVLQGVNFGLDYPKYINFGAMGYISGFGITQGFNDQGAQYDGDGNVKNWWETDTENKFINKTQCFIDQYSVTDPETNVTMNGALTLSVNIADNGGLKQTYLAYKNLMGNMTDVLLPGFENFTSTQMLWLGFGTIFCSKQRPEYRKAMMAFSPITDEQYRVNFVAKNMAQFGHDWGCQAGSPMVPNMTCTLW